MKIEDIIKLEDANGDAIILMKEGMFWRAYERSAFRFVRLIHEYQVLVKHFKNIDRKVAYLGFPSERLPQVLARAKIKGWKTAETENGNWIISGIPIIDGFLEWKESLPEKPKPLKNRQNVADETGDRGQVSEVSPLPVYKDAYDLMLEIYQFSKQFHREYRFTLGERLKNEVLELLIRVYQAQTGNIREEHIVEARNHAETARLLLRITKDLRLIELKRFIRLNETIEDILRQLTGWLKSQRKCRSPSGGNLPE
jgi:hypothetical protein